MAETYALKTFSDIYTAVLEELKLQASDTTSLNRIKKAINRAYINEVVEFDQWKWLRGKITLVHQSAFATGTATVTEGSTTVTVTTAPAASRKGQWFSINGQNELYRIAQHTANSTTIVLDTPYLGDDDSELSFKIWSDTLFLPADARDVIKITHDNQNVPVEGHGLQKFREIVATGPKTEARPCYHSVGDYIDPAPYETISGLPALSTRASDGLVRTLVYATTVASLLSPGDRIEVSGSSEAGYNGEYVVSSVSTTTITYTGNSILSEAAIADTSLVVKTLGVKGDNERYRELLVYPSIYSSKTALHVDYIKEAPPLSDDDDEPLMPIGDRIVLFYAGCQWAWSTIGRNPEEAKRNFDLYQAKLARMAGKLDDSTDYPVLRPSKIYLGAKRQVQRQRDSKYSGWGNTGSGSSSSQSAILGTANTVAIYDASGELEGSSSVTTTELNQLDGILSKAVGLTDTQQLSNKSIDADTNTITNIENADIKAAAAIERSKLAALTASRVIVSDASGFDSVSVITPTELTYLDDVETLTSATLADNTAAAADVATWLHASFSSIQVNYSLSRGAGNRESGTLYIVTDGTTAGLAQAGASIGTPGVTFTVDISGTSVRLRYTTTSTGTAVTMKYKVQKWAA